MTEHQLARMVDLTMEQVKLYLDIFGIPYYEEDFKRSDDRLNRPILIFDWADGADVMVRWKYPDDMKSWVTYPGETLNPYYIYPLIETCGFPFDDGDVTVFGSPIELAKKLYECHREKIAE